LTIEACRFFFFPLGSETCGPTLFLFTGFLGLNVLLFLAIAPCRLFGPDDQALLEFSLFSLFEDPPIRFPSKLSLGVRGLSVFTGWEPHHFSWGSVFPLFS